MLYTCTTGLTANVHMYMYVTIETAAMSHPEYGHMVSLSSKENTALAVRIQDIHRCSSHSKLLECIHLSKMGSC